MTHPMADDFTQGRVRVRQDTAAEVWEALLKHEEDLRDGRATVVGTSSEAVNRFNRRLAATRRGKDELRRVYEERGWPLEPERSE